MVHSQVRSFRARLEHNQSRLNWVIVRIPFDAARIWGARGMIRVKGEINGFAFRTSLFPTGKGGHTLLVNKRMQRGAGATLGKVADFLLQPDAAERTVPVPMELKAALAEDRQLARWHEGLNYSTRKYIADWITDVKSHDARERRAQQIAERLLATMEAEDELPPILQVEFLRNSPARAGWERMSEARRRAHLMGIFYYRTPEARAGRIAKMLQEAEELAARQEGHGRRPGTKPGTQDPQTEGQETEEPDTEEPETKRPPRKTSSKRKNKRNQDENIDQNIDEKIEDEAAKPKAKASGRRRNLEE